MALHQLMRAIGLLVVATVCYISVYNGTTLFTWHPVLMSVGVSNPPEKKIDAPQSTHQILTNQYCFFLFTVYFIDV